VIIAAQATLAKAIVVSDNIRHLEQFVEARPWASIKP